MAEIPQQSPQETKPNTDTFRDFQHEFLWPLSSLISFTKPLHFFILKHFSQIEEGDAVLELGSGMIPYYEMYAKKVGDTGVFVALDSRETVQKGAKDIGYWFGKLFGKKDTIETPKVVAEADKSLPFPDETFDKILMSNLPTQAIDESWRVLKEGGTLIFCFNELFSVPVITLLFRKLMRDKNFTEIRLVPISPGSIPLIFTNWALTGKKQTK